MRLPNGYNIMCRCGRPDCIEKTGELGPGCVQEYGLWLPNRYLSQAKSYVPADRARKLVQACKEYLEEMLAREPWPEFGAQKEASQ